MDSCQKIVQLKFAFPDSEAPKFRRTKLDLSKFDRNVYTKFLKGQKDGSCQDLWKDLFGLVYIRTKTSSFNVRLAQSFSYKIICPVVNRASLAITKGKILWRRQFKMLYKLNINKILSYKPVDNLIGKSLRS